VTVEWSNVAPSQVIVLWQSSQSFEVSTCPTFFSWQLWQLAVTPEWSKLTVVQFDVTWQRSQSFDVVICPTFFSWQLWQLAVVSA
jgi:hypothetical protein